MILNLILLKMILIKIQQLGHDINNWKEHWSSIWLSDYVVNAMRKDLIQIIPVIILSWNNSNKSFCILCKTAWYIINTN